MPVSVPIDLIGVSASVVLAIFTIILALVDWLYYHQRKLQTDEMKKTRRLRYEPKMKAGLKPSEPNFEIGFVNIGRGIAHNVEAEYWVEGLEEYKRNWGTAIHFPEDIYRIGIPLDDSSVGTIGMTEKIEPELDGEQDKFIIHLQ